MQEVRIYHKIFSSLPWWALLGCFLFTAFGIYSAVTEPYMRREWMLWLSIVICGGAFLFFPLVALKERMSQSPAITIMESKILCCNPFKSKIQVYRLDEIRQFELREMESGVTHYFASIIFEKDAAESRMQNLSKLKKQIMQSNEMLVGGQELISLDGLTMKPQEIMDLLEQRLKMSKL